LPELIEFFFVRLLHTLLQHYPLIQIETLPVLMHYLLQMYVCVQQSHATKCLLS